MFRSGINIVAGFTSAAASSGFGGFGWGLISTRRFLVHLSLLAFRVRNVDVVRGTALQGESGSPREKTAAKQKSVIPFQSP